MLSLLNQNNMKYRILEKEGFGFKPQVKYWWWFPFWIDCPCYEYYFSTYEDAKKVIDNQRIMFDGYTKIHYPYTEDEPK